MVISASVLDDLNAARHNAMRTFTNDLRRLTPKNAPVSTWSHVHDRQQLADSLEEFIDSRADQFRVQGNNLTSTNSNHTSKFRTNRKKKRQHNFVSRYGLIVNVILSRMCERINTISLP